MNAVRYPVIPEEYASAIDDAEARAWVIRNFEWLQYEYLQKSRDSFVDFMLGRCERAQGQLAASLEEDCDGD